MSKESAEKIYITIKSVYIELYGHEITESRTVTLSPKIYSSILKNSEKYNVSPHYIAKIMGFRPQDAQKMEI